MVEEIKEASKTIKETSVQSLKDSMSAAKELFSESNGTLSSMRLMAAAALVMAAWVTYKSVEMKQVNENLNLIITWLGFAFGGKSFQKFAEKPATIAEEVK